MGLLNKLVPGTDDEPEENRETVELVVQDEESNYECEECGETFETRQGYGGHLSGHEQETSESTDEHVCEDCGKEFDSHNALGGHRRAHMTYCNECEREFESTRGLKVHKTRSH